MRLHPWSVLVASAVLASCVHSSTPIRAPRPERVDAGGAGIFSARGVRGAFVLLDESTGETTVVSPAMADEPFSPASTFKIPHTLIALETGVIHDERFTLRWDGTKYPIASWNRDHDLTSAMRESVVWFYQEIARRIGAQRMKQYLENLPYGNRDISGGLDQFWLDGTLRISARQQIEFLRRLDAGELPVSARSAALVRRILVVYDERPGQIWRGKTGFFVSPQRIVGWVVGYVDRGDKRFAYAMVAEGDPAQREALKTARLEITRELLVRTGALQGRATYQRSGVGVRYKTRPPTPSSLRAAAE